MKELVQQLEIMTMSMRAHPDCVFKKNIEFCDYVDSSIEMLCKYPEYTTINWKEIND